MEPQEYHTLFEVEDTHWWFRSLHELVVGCLSEMLRQAQHDVLHLLDAGCGTGGLAKKLIVLGDVEAIDNSSLAIEYCKKRGLQNVHQADLNTLALPEAAYDAITCIDVLYHREIRDPAKVLRMFFKALKPGGILFLHLPAFEFLRSAHDTKVHTGHRYSLKEVRSLLWEAGFTVEWSSYRLMLLFLPVLLFKLLCPHRKHSDAETPPVLLNVFLLALSRMENAFSRIVPLPFGVSLYAVARKAQNSSAI